MHERIVKELRQLESARGIQVLYACESGSRAWGFPSPDSDYDVRFIYAEPLPHHLSLGKKSDTIDLMLPDDLDLAGWELSKTLGLFAKSNIALFEWLGSPVQYFVNDPFLKDLAAQIPKFFNPKRAMFHYAHMAATALGEGWRGEPKTIKKLLYAIRAWGCCEWILTFGTMPPTNFAEILGQPDLVPGPVAAVIKNLIQWKSSQPEKFEILPEPNLTQWLLEVQEGFEGSVQDMRANDKSSRQPLNAILQHWTLAATDKALLAPFTG